jgi:hypothetical protein
VVYTTPSTGRNEALGNLVGSLIVKTAGNRSRRDHLGDPLACGEDPTRAIHGVTRQRAWPLRGHRYVRLQRGLGRNLRTSRYLGKNTRIIERDFASLSLFSFRT